ncbi:MAG: hypothetical protein ACYCQK_06965 [Acidiferrobacteraceae bacterium]
MMISGRSPIRTVVLGCVMACACFVPVAKASSAGTSVDGNAFGQASGSVQVNLAAGSGNQQINTTSLAIGHDATATNRITQNNSNGAGATGGNFSANISGGAFQNASGLISLNEVSGTGNAQANEVAISLAGLGGNALSGNSLSQVASGGSQGKPTLAPQDQDSASIKGDAFAHANGLIQINQVAGRSNATANQFAFELQLGAHP